MPTVGREQFATEAGRRRLSSARSGVERRDGAGGGGERGDSLLGPGPEVITTACSIPSAASAANRPANASDDSPSSKRVLTVFMASR